MRRAAHAVALILASAVAALAGDGRRMLGGEEAAAWSGVGRLNIAGNRFCTATLISDRLVLTAAHCLYNPRTAARVRVGEMRFVAGLRLGAHAGVRRIAAAATLPGYRYDSAATTARVSMDVALLALDAPIHAAVFPAASLRPNEGAMTLVSYARDRAHAPSIERGCRVTSRVGVIAALDCDVTYGVSGAPVFSTAGDRARVVALVSAMGRVDGERVALAVTVSQALPELRARLESALAGAEGGASVALAE